jgi:uncharacterized membrane protein YqaE (UPF0057 family)
MRVLTALLIWVAGTQITALAQSAQPLVAIHDSELTRALESLPATSPTPTGAGTTGFEWWPTDWHYFVMPDSLKESLRSDGTSFTVVGDSNITAGVLLTNGLPKYPILISLAAEAINDSEISAFTNYVAAGGFLVVGSSSFTRNTNGTTRGDFAFANALGLHSSVAGLSNWIANNTVTKALEHRIVSHLPNGVLTWRMPGSSEETPWGLSPDHPFLAPHDLWRVVNADSTILARGDTSPFLTVKPYGKGYFIYCAAFQPLMGHSGFAPTTYAFMILRRSIEWAFESQNLPVPRLSPWPYPYDAALMVRHDLENFTNEVAAIESSAQFEFTNHALGDYYFCTGTLREDAWPTFDTNSIIAGLRRAITNYGATIGPHNGGLKNPNNNALLRGDYDYWHWGTDEALATNPPGYASGKAYATISLSNSFNDIEYWLTGLTNGLRTWVQCYFNGTREDSYDLQAQLGVNISGDQKIGPFPHWTLSTKTPDKHYSFLTEPVSDWFIGGLVGQSLEPWHAPGIETTNTLHAAIDFFYGFGGLINFYSHTLSTGFGPAGDIATEYVNYSVNTNLHPRLWGANGVLIYQWWLQRSNATVSSSYHTNANGQSVTTLAISHTANTNASVEIETPASGYVNALQVFTNNVLAGASEYRTNGQIIKLRVSTSVTNAEFRYFLGPKAANDSYSASAGSALSVSAPGVLANDGLGAIGGVTLALVAAPAHGSLNLDTNTGAFLYTPANGFSGSDSFSYSLTDTAGDTSTASVSILVSAGDIFFTDDFTRASDPGPLTPWVENTGIWTVTGGTMTATNTTLAYANVYLTNSWNDYCAEARIRFPTNAFGGGLGARLNPVTGSHYAAWIYPEGSGGGSLLLKLIKFQDWADFSYLGGNGVVLSQVSLTSVGTNYHTVKLGFRGTRVTVYFDGIQRITMNDAEVQPYTAGGVSLDFWTPSTPYLFAADDVVVKPLVVSDAYAATEDTALSIPAPGVLTNDTGVFGTNLTASLISTTSHGSLNLNSDGSFSYLPSTNYNGPDSFIYQASDSGTNLGSATVTLTVASVNDAPRLPSQTNLTIAELTPLVVTNSASDPDTSPSSLAYSLLNPPSGATIDTNGVITWTPTEAQGPSTNTITTVVTDNGIPALSATNQFTVIVTEVNSAPVLPVQTNRIISELSTLIATNTATDSDLPANVLTYSLLSPAAGITITNGVITWTPTEAQGPSTNTITTVVTDNGTPPLSATNQFTVIVTEVNSAPVLPVQTNRTIPELTTLTVTNVATDSDLPANSLTYSLLSPPAGVTLTNGIITWTPTEAQGPSTNTITTVVTDNGTPALSATNQFTVVVTEVNSAPVLPAQPDQTIPELTTLTVTNVPTDYDIPANILTFCLLRAASVLSITYGVITWTPTEAQGPSTNTITTVVTDNGTPALSATNQFTVVVSEVNSAPVLPAQPDQTIPELTTLTVTNTATDSDLPANILTYSLLSPPAGVTITNGVITWTPNEAQGPSTNTITTVVTDNGTPALSVTNQFTVIVTEVNSAPVLPAQPDQTIPELTTLTVTNVATDSDLPANILTYSLLSPPAGVTITNGIITWTPTETQGPSTNTITTVVTDNGIPALSATNQFTVIVTEVNSAPVLPAEPDQTIPELATLTVTNVATDSDLPANILTYSLLSPPAGVSITNGVITWTPTEAQGPSTNTITTVVTDNGVPPLSATNQFTVVVTEVNSAPALPIQPDRSIPSQTSLIVTNTATDADLPANILNYLLLSSPTNAQIDADGIITWTPSAAQAPSTNLFETVVTDNGLPPLSATNSFTVIVSAPPIPPQIISISLTNGLAQLLWTSIAGAHYTVQYQDQIQAATWTSSIPEVIASGATATASVSGDGVTQRYFRVVLHP